MAQGLLDPSSRTPAVPLSNTEEEAAIIRARPAATETASHGRPAGALAVPLRRLASIQYLRAVAAIAVLAYHVAGEPLVVGAAGVDVFFVISGFVIGLVVAGKAPDPLTFAYDRATRILPLYWVFTVLLVATKLAAPALLPGIQLDPGWVARSLLLIPATVPGTSNAFPVLYQGWTLWYEALFYGLAAAAIVLAPNRQAVALTGMIVCLVLAGLMLDPQGPAAITYTSPLLVEFLAGYGFALWRKAGGRLSTPLANGLLLGGIGGFAAAAILAGSPEGWTRLVVWGLPAMALVAGAVALDDSGRLPASRLLSRLGDASYAIYLSHGMAISALVLLLKRVGMPLDSALGQPLLGLAVGVGATAAGLAVHVLVERPMMDWFRRWRPKPPAIALKIVPAASLRQS